MGHVRLGRLPTSRNWQEVVALLEQDAPVDAIAAGASGAAEIDLDAAASDSGFTRVCWLLAQIPLAARSPDFAEGLRGLGLVVGQSPDLFEIGGALSDAVDRYVDGARQRTDFGEMAQLAAAESLSAVAGRFLPVRTRVDPQSPHFMTAPAGLTAVSSGTPNSVGFYSFRLGQAPHCTTTRRPELAN